MNKFEITTLGNINVIYKNTIFVYKSKYNKDDDDNFMLEIVDRYYHTYREYIKNQIL